MDIILTIPDEDVDAMSAAWANRVPLLTDDKNVVTETAEEHLERAYDEYLDIELQAARVTVAREAVKTAKTDDELKDAMLVEHNLRHP